MGFGEAVAAEAFQLLERAFGEFRRVAVVEHAPDQLLLKFVDAAGELERRHRAPQLIGFGRREAGRDHRDLHCLFLKQRDAEGLSEHLLQGGSREFDLLLSLPPADVGMHHVALYRTWPYDGDLDDEIVERLGLHARQHVHLRAGFDLKHAGRIRPADHRVRGRILGRNGREVEALAFCAIEQVEGAAHAAEHAEAQHIDLHELQRVDVVLVPLDDLTVLHRCRFDGHHFIQAVQRQYEAARVLRKMARRADQFLITACRLIFNSLASRSATPSSLQPQMRRASDPVTSAGRPSALPTSRTAPRER